VSDLSFVEEIEAKFTLDNPKNYTMSFHKDDEVIGTLDFNTGVMKFEGNADESAKVFIDFIAEHWADRLQQEYQKGINASKETKQ